MAENLVQDINSLEQAVNRIEPMTAGVIATLRQDIELTRIEVNQGRFADVALDAEPLRGTLARIGARLAAAQSIVDAFNIINPPAPAAVGGARRRRTRRSKRGTRRH